MWTSSDILHSGHGIDLAKNCFVQILAYATYPFYLGTANMEKMQGKGFITSSMTPEARSSSRVFWLYREERPDLVGEHAAPSLLIHWAWFGIRLHECRRHPSSIRKHLSDWILGRNFRTRNCILDWEHYATTVLVTLHAVLPQIGWQRLVFTRRHINRQVNDPRFTFIFTVHNTGTLPSYHKTQVMTLLGWCPSGCNHPFPSCRYGPVKRCFGR